MDQVKQRTMLELVKVAKEKGMKAFSYKDIAKRCIE